MAMTMIMIEDEGWGHDDSPVLSIPNIIILIMKRMRLMMMYRNADGKLKILELLVSMEDIREKVGRGSNSCKTS